MQRHFIKQGHTSLWTLAIGAAFSLLFLGLLIMALPVLLLLSVVLIAVSFFIGPQRIQSMMQGVWQQCRPRYHRQRDIYQKSPNVQRENKWQQGGRVFEHRD